MLGVSTLCLRSTSRWWPAGPYLACGTYSQRDFCRHTSSQCAALTHAWLYANIPDMTERLVTGLGHDAHEDNSSCRPDSAPDVLLWLAAGHQYSGDSRVVKGGLCTATQKVASHTCSCHPSATADLSVHLAQPCVQVVEPVWGSKEYIKYLVLVNTASGVSTFFVIYLAYAMDRNNEGNLLCAA